MNHDALAGAIAPRCTELESGCDAPTSVPGDRNTTGDRHPVPGPALTSTQQGHVRVKQKRHGVIVNAEHIRPTLWDFESRLENSPRHKGMQEASKNVLSVKAGRAGLSGGYLMPAPSCVTKTKQGR